MSPAIIFVVYLYIMSPGSMCIVHDIADDSVSTCSVYFCTYIDDNVMCVATPFPFYFDQIVGFDEWEPWPILQDRRGQAVRWSTTSGLSIGAKAENLVFVPNATTGKTYMYIIQKRGQVYVFYFPFWESGKTCLRFIITIEKYMETLRKCQMFDFRHFSDS